MRNPGPSSVRLLVLAPNWLGDVVMHSPLLSLLDASRNAVDRATGENLVVHLGIRPEWADLFRDDPRLDELVVLDRKRLNRGPAGPVRLAGRLKAGAYDAIILCPPSFRAGLASWLARIPVRVGYRTDGRSMFLSRGLPVSPRGDQHYSLEMIQLGKAWLASLGIEEPVVGDTPVLLPGCDEVPPADLGSGRPVWAVAPGTTYGEAKTWPADRLGEFIRLALERSKVRVALLGDAAARSFTAQLRDHVPATWGEDFSSGAEVVDLTGSTNLKEAVGVLKSAAAFVGNDSGLMHVAGALGLPTVGIFGSSNPDWTSPLGPRTRALTASGFDCRPCYLKTCNQPRFCLETVSADSVLSAVQLLDGEIPAGREGL